MWGCKGCEGCIWGWEVVCAFGCGGCVAVEVTGSEVNTSEVSNMADRSEMGGKGEVTESFSEDVE